MKVQFRILMEIGLTEENVENINEMIKDVGKKGLVNLFDKEMNEEIRSWFPKDDIITLEVKSKLIKG